MWSLTPGTRGVAFRICPDLTRLVVGRWMGSWEFCTIHVKDSSHESSVLAGMCESLGPYEIQDDELVVLQ
jgi:hypothetical protein